MRQCPYCKEMIPDTGDRCPICGSNPNMPPVHEVPPAYQQPNPGQPVYPQNPNIPYQPYFPQQSALRDDPDTVLAKYRQRLHAEYKSWLIFGIAMLALIACIALLLVFTEGALRDAVYEILGYDGLPAAYAGTVALLTALLLLPIPVVCFIMAGKVKTYWAEAAYDAERAYRHSSSVGVIVIAALFSTITLIFVILNFVLCKSKREALTAAIAKQKAHLPPQD